MLESDRAVYALVGIVTIAVFVGGVVVFALGGEFGPVEVAPLAVGFLLFMIVFFLAYGIRLVERDEDRSLKSER